MSTYTPFAVQTDRPPSPPNFREGEYDYPAPRAIQAPPIAPILEDYDSDDETSDLNIPPAISQNLGNPKFVALSSVFSAAVAIGCIATIVLVDFGQVFNSYLGLATAIFGYYSVTVLLSKNARDTLNDWVILFSAFLYMDSSNAASNAANVLNSSSVFHITIITGIIFSKALF